MTSSNLPPLNVSQPLPPIPAVDHYCGNEKTMLKALALQQNMGPVFDITFDCEDGAATGQERVHATLVAELLHNPNNCFNRVGIRIHDVGHPHWREDLAIIFARSARQIAYITLPKAQSANDVRTALAAIRAAEAAHGLTQPIPLHVLIETHGALHQAWEIAALPHVQSLDFGLMDFVSEHRGALHSAAMVSPGQFEHPIVCQAKSQIVAAALAHGILPTHNVTTTLDRIELIASDARQARAFGFLRMWSIHPTQIEPILRAMRPTDHQIEEAQAILLAAETATWGPIRFEGRLHDRASYRYYWDILQRAHATGLSLDPAVQHFFGTPRFG